MYAWIWRQLPRSAVLRLLLLLLAAAVPGLIQHLVRSVGPSGTDPQPNHAIRHADGLDDLRRTGPSPVRGDVGCLPLRGRRSQVKPQSRAMFLTEDREILVDETSLARLSAAWQRYDHVNNSPIDDFDPVDALQRAGRVLRAVAPVLRSARSR